MDRMAAPVLVVDDDDGFRALAVGLLRAAGHDRVEEAGTVAEALTKLTRTHFAAALVDIGLPDGDGLGLAEQLARLPDPPLVVLISADADAADDAAVRRSGAAAFLLKEELADARLRELLGTA